MSSYLKHDCVGDDEKFHLQGCRTPRLKSVYRPVLYPVLGMDWLISETVQSDNPILHKCTFRHEFGCATSGCHLQ